MRRHSRAEASILELLVIVGLVLANGVLAGAEMAIVSVRASRLRELMDRGSAAARAVARLRRSPETFLATVQVGISVVGAAAGAFGGAVFAQDVEHLVAAVPPLAPWAREIAFVTVVLLISYLSIVLGELVPKSLALRASERYALLVARPLLLAASVMRPVVWLLAASSNAVLRAFGDSTSFVETRLSREEVRGVVEDATRSGSVHPSAGDIAARAIELTALDAEHVMVHRRFATVLSAELTRDAARARLVAAARDLAPVVEPVTGEVLGYVTLRDVVAGSPAADDGPLRALVRPARFVPEGMPAADLLAEFQERPERLAVVVDEHGGMVGVVTVESLVDELIGAMLGASRTAPGRPFEVQSDGTVLVEGTVPIREVNRRLGVELPRPADAALVGGLCVVLAGGRLPAAGERFSTPDGSELTVTDVSPRRVRTVRLRPPPRDVTDDAGTD